MKVKELINKLMDYDLNSEVEAWVSVDNGNGERPEDIRLREHKIGNRAYTHIVIEDDYLDLVTRCEDCMYLTNTPHKQMELF